MLRRLADPVLCLLATLGLLSGLCAFLRVAPNRLLSGDPVMLWMLRPPAVALLLASAWLALWLLAWWPRQALRGWLSAALCSALLIALPVTAGIAAAGLSAGAPTLARIQPAAGAWLMLLCAGLLLADRLRMLALARVATALWLLALICAGWGVIASGVLDTLAPMREYAMQRAPFHAAVLRHLALVGMGVVLALLAGVPLGLLAHRRGRAGRVVLATLNVLQTVPSIALFALLIAPLAWLARQWPALSGAGIGGTGAAPAVIALALYALLPIVRSIIAGLDAVPHAVLDAARGMGMRPLQQLWRIQVPLGWPVLLAGLRVVTVQSIGLAAVAALIGAGGLGHFVFLGLGQGANDLVVLGTLAIVALALAADALFQGLGQLMGGRA